MSSIQVIFPKASDSKTESDLLTTSVTIKKFQSLKFSVATRRFPLLVFWFFLGIAVLVAGCLAHNRHSWQAFWNQEAVLNREWALDNFPLARLFDSFTTRINRIFIKSGWIFAAIILILVQTFYIILIVLKRDHVPNLQFIRQFSVHRLIFIEIGVLLLGTFYFVICTWSFNRLASITGSCTYIDRSFAFPISLENCKSPAIFRGFDISGHCFLIVHSCLLVMEYAAKVLFVWKIKTRGICASTVISDKDSDLENAQIFDEYGDENETYRFNDSQADEPQSNFFLNRNYFIYRFQLIILFILIFLLCLLEIFVFLQTILFYHTVTEKIIGTLIGSGFWFGLFGLSLKYPHLF